MPAIRSASVEKGDGDGDQSDAAGRAVRDEEAFGGEWRDVDLERSMFRVRRAYAKGRLKDFRACLGEVRRTADGIVLSRQAADLLEVKEGDTVLAVSR